MKYNLSYSRFTLTLTNKGYTMFKVVIFKDSAWQVVDSELTHDQAIERFNFNKHTSLVRILRA